MKHHFPHRSQLLQLILVALVTLSSTAVHAEWDGGIEGGTVVSDGDASTRLRLKLFNNDKPLNQTIYADWIRSENGDNSYEGGYRPRYYLTDQFYGFGEARLRVDKPLLIDQETLFLAGLGYTLFDTGAQHLWVEVGAGQQNTEFESVGGVMLEEIDDTITLARGELSQVLSDLVRLEVEANIADSNRLRESTIETGLSVRMSGGALKYSYRIKRSKLDNTAAIESTDSFVSFSYGF